MANQDCSEGIWERVPPKMWGAIIALAALAAMGRTVLGGFLDYDDPWYVVNNAAITHFSWDNIRAIWLTSKMPQYYPMVFSSYLIEHSLFGMKPSVFHATNVLLHAINSVLAYAVVRKLSGSTVAAVITGLLFAVHPVHVESVAWITERKDMLSGLFFLLSMLVYLKYTETLERKHYLLSFGSFVLAMLSKTMAATLPAVLLLIDWRKGRGLGAKVLLEKLPFALLSVIMMGVTWVVEHRGASPADDALKSIYSPLSGIAAPAFYLQKALLPIKLSMIYPPIHTNPLELVIRIAVTAAVVALAYIYWRRRNEAGMWMLAFLIMLVPVAGVVPFRYVMRTSPVADHFMYLPALGVFAAVGVLAALWVQRSGKQAQVASLAVTGVVTVVLIWLSVVRSGAFMSGETLWQDALRKNHSVTSAVPLNNLGTIVAARGDYKRAGNLFSSALEHIPDYGEALNNLGLVYLKTGDLPNAEIYIKKALNGHPAYSVFLINMGDLRLAQGRRDDAEALYRRAIKSKPDSFDARARLGQALIAMGETEAGLDQYHALVYYHVRHPRSYVLYGNALAQVGKADEARDQLDMALEFDPGNVDALSSLAALDAGSGDVKSARERLSQALKALPRSAALHMQMAYICMLDQDPAGAVEHLQKASLLNPRDPEIQLRLGTVLKARGDVKSAVSSYERGLKLEPVGRVRIDLLNNLSWVLSTSPDSEIRQPSRSLTLAREASKLTGGSAPGILDTLAAAEARSGDYAAAAATQGRCIKLLKAQGKQSTDEQRRLALYKSSSPYTQTP